MNYSDITDYTVKVCMLKGESGETIKGIEKTSSSGLKDTYTITLSNGDKHTFTVENGNGIKSIAKTNTSGLVDTYTITFDNGNTSTFTVTNGEGVNTLKIGGRNLAKGTNRGTHLWRSGFEKPEECSMNEDIGSRGERCVKFNFSGYTSRYSVIKFSEFSYHLRNNISALNGKKITVSFDTKSDFPIDCNVSVRDGDFHNSMTSMAPFRVPGAGRWEKIITTIDVTSSEVHNQCLYIGLSLDNKPTYLEIGNLKVELGTVATDWTPALEDTDEKITSSVLNAYPIGSIYMSVNSTPPATLFGGTWESLGGRFLLGADSTYTAGSTGGEATHTLTTAEMPAHKHNLSDDSRAHSFYWGMKDADVHVGVNASGGAGTDNNLGTKQTDWATTGTTGKGQAHNNMPPYLVVYMWKRTA